MTTVSTKSGRIIKVVSREEEKSTLTIIIYSITFYIKNTPEPKFWGVTYFSEAQ